MRLNASLKRVLLIFIGVLLALFFYTLVPNETYPLAPAVAAMIIFMAFLWVTELIPLAVTSLIPIVFLPAIGVGELIEITSFYARPIIYLFLGGFILAIGIQTTGLHKRIALFLLYKIGDKPHQLVLGFMIASALLSMWISNTASVMVMMPVGLSVLDTAKTNGLSSTSLKNLGLGIMLGLAYAADIGGMSTLIGTPPNLVFLEMYSELFPNLPQVGFVTWMIMVMPMSVLFLFSGWFVLTKIVFKLPNKRLLGGHLIIEQEYKKLGKMTADEKRAGLIFLLAALLWLTGSDIQFGESFRIYGWRSLLNLPEFKDASVAIFAAILLFIVPSKNKNKKTILIWKDTLKVPWGILLLFGGGLALAGGFQLSGLGHIVGNGFANWQVESETVAVFSVSFILTFLTEITSNTAITNLILPIIAEASKALQIDPRLLMIPATLSASCSFMMPGASPTQAIVFGSGYVSIKDMIRGGLWFNFIGIILVSVIFLVWGRFVIGI
jgi:sodium-dependent dicarboxylate transporter 2/3/5